MEDIVFFDIDTQYSFMHKKGRFYVKGAEKIIPNLKRITQFAKEKSISVIASMDNHKMPGQEKIKETRFSNAFSIPNRKLSDKKIKRLREKNRLLIEKQKHDVFSNPNTKKLLQSVKKAFVYGVATDSCVKEAVLGLREMGIETYVVIDAIRSTSKDNEKKYIVLFKKKGAKFLTTSQLLKIDNLLSITH
ncbi:isochorismatase family protein [Candidatus Woesearchaeota archaeon]|nr:isochorismatase family protein [Candidatus Woesearchaeota archaeon]